MSAHRLCLWTVFIAVITTGFLLFNSPAKSAPPKCYQSGPLKKMLKTQYGEYPVASGMVGPFAIVFYANEKKGTWTIIRFDPRGVGCMVAAGTDFNRFKKPKHPPVIGRPA